MIIGVGTDLVSVGRIEHMMQQFGDKFSGKIFTDSEVERANQIKITKDNILPRALFYAKRFAAKEAFAKAIGLGIGRGIDFKDIEVQNDDLGKPSIKILNDKESFLQKHFNCEKFAIHLSITDENPLASAIVIIDKIA